MLVELHIVQNFAPSNLNRDDSGAPKDCEFGGYRRARISSQCIKRAIRQSFQAEVQRGEGSLEADNLARRTKLLVKEVADQLAAKGRDREIAGRVVASALKGLGFGLDDAGKTEYLLVVGTAQIEALAAACDASWEALVSTTESEAKASKSAAPAGGKGPRAQKQAGQQAVPASVREALEHVLDGGRAVDLALFGRMLADRPDRNVDAACQVAHAISTHRVSVEFDFYTAVDDLQPRAETGAGMMGTVEFNSACYYRYSNVDLEQLARNLGGDAALAARALEAFVRASVSAVPTGKQNSMAAQNPPSLVLAVARDRGLWSLANAFVRPVTPTGGAASEPDGGDLVGRSVAALDTYWGQIRRMYGGAGIVGWWCTGIEDAGLRHLKGGREDGRKRGWVESVDELVSELLAGVRGGVGGDGGAA